MNQYKGGKGADRQTWLSFWNGAQVVVNRKSKETGVLHHPHVCVTGCLPPDVLVDLDDERRRTDGFLHRILFAIPHVPPLTWTKNGVAEETLHGYSAVIALLLCLEGIDTEGTPQSLVLHFTLEGAEAWERWVIQHYLVDVSRRHLHDSWVGNRPLQRGPGLE